MHLLKFTAISVSKVIINGMEFTLPFAAFLLIGAVYVKIIYLPLKTPVWVCVKIFLTAAEWATIGHTA